MAKKWRHKLESLKTWFASFSTWSRRNSSLFIRKLQQERNKVTIGDLNCPIVTEDDGQIVCTIPKNKKGIDKIAEENVIILSSSKTTQVIKNGLAYIGDPKLWMDGDDGRSINLEKTNLK